MSSIYPTGYDYDGVTRTLTGPVTRTDLELGTYRIITDLVPLIDHVPADDRDRAWDLIIEYGTVRARMARADAELGPVTRA